MTAPSTEEVAPIKPLVSIVIVSWNTRELLRACLSSVGEAAAGVPGAVQVIVVDNASCDGTIAMVQQQFAAVLTIANLTNRGFAAATNQGIAQSSGHYVLLLNPDTTVMPDAMTHLVEFMNDHPCVGAAGPRVIGGDGVLQESCFPLPTLGREAWRLFQLDRVHRVSRYPLLQWSRGAPRRVEALQGACLLVRRQVLDQIGPLDERFYIYTEEVDLCRRMQDAGWGVYWVPAALIMHLSGQSTRQVACRMFLELYRSKVQYFRKHGGTAVAWAYKLVLLSAAVPRIMASGLTLVITSHQRREVSSMFRNYVRLVLQLPSL